MKEHRFRVWHLNENRMYYRGYQKFWNVLLCDDDKGTREGRGLPVRKASYGECIFLEGTGVYDRAGREVFEGDIIRIRHQGRTADAVVGPVPDSFGNRGAHPLRTALEAAGIAGNPEKLDVEVLGNTFETPQLKP
jgi:hypothetical protein